MRLLNKVLIGAAIVSVFAIGAIAASVASGGVESTSPAVDISGPCDEAEHANDPQCVGAQPLEDNDAVEDDDISGPCDEAEHANDPRCSGVGDDDDNSGPGNGDEDGDHDNSGPGSGDDDDDNSGPSDNSGPGSGEDD